MGKINVRRMFFLIVIGLGIMLNFFNFFMILFVLYSI